MNRLTKFIIDIYIYINMYVKRKEKNGGDENEGVVAKSSYNCASHN